MRILIDCSNYFLDNENHGDRAIYQVMVRRLTTMWPAATIHFITLDPDLIERNCPGVRPLVLTERHNWEMFPAALVRRSRSRRGVFLGGLRLQPRCRALCHTYPPHDIQRFAKTLREADLVMATGGGYFSDCFAKHAEGLLDTLQGGLYFGKPTVLMGGGFEPVQDAGLQAKARAVLPCLDLISCREHVTGPALLRDMGVPNERVLVTGDDAVELAFDARPPKLGTGLGVNVRQSSYAEINDGVVEPLCAALREAIRKYHAPLVPVPISLFGPSDPVSIAKVLARCGVAEDGRDPPRTPLEAVQHVGRCRVVVTGSYHAAVFALSQGIPVVAFGKSLHYDTKLRGVAAQFGRGCTVLGAGNPDFQAALQAAIEQAWETAEEVRPRLLEAARQQIDAGWRAYRRVSQIVDA